MRSFPQEQHNGALQRLNAHSKLIPDSKIVDNHCMIDPVATVYERGMPEYQPLRRTVVRLPLSLWQPLANVELAAAGRALLDRE